MATNAINLAIETSSRDGGVAVGRGDALIESVSLGPQQRHAVALMPAIDRLAQAHRFEPGDIGQVYLSIGPGSFTGLRIAVTVAKMLARGIGSKLVAVPTLDVVAANAPTDAGPRLAVCLNAKGGRCFTGRYERSGGGWFALGEADLLTPGQVAAVMAGPFALLGDAAVGALDWPAQATQLDATLAVPRAEQAWRLGRAIAARGEFVDPYALTPLYVRLPDAEEKRRQRQSAAEPRR